uniref:uncharacterized protein LOC117604499 n=1 Tax=Osmia lignaria TaxID=473952 RepID=UPI001478FA4A|nr:uncharacterized protein LOC117604499 [Osmia lignaria]
MRSRPLVSLRFCPVIDGASFFRLLKLSDEKLDNSGGTRLDCTRRIKEASDTLRKRWQMLIGERSIVDHPSQQGEAAKDDTEEETRGSCWRLKENTRGNEQDRI